MTRHIASIQIKRKQIKTQTHGYVAGIRVENNHPPRGRVSFNRIKGGGVTTNTI